MPSLAEELDYDKILLSFNIKIAYNDQDNYTFLYWVC